MVAGASIYIYIYIYIYSQNVELAVSKLRQTHSPVREHYRADFILSGNAKKSYRTPANGEAQYSMGRVVLDDLGPMKTILSRVKRQWRIPRSSRGAAAAPAAAATAAPVATPTLIVVLTSLAVALALTPASLPPTAPDTALFVAI